MICYTKESSCTAIGIRDNGIGFDMKHKDTKLKIFSGLYDNTKYRIRGVGFILIDRIMNMRSNYVDIFC